MNTKTYRIYIARNSGSGVARGYMGDTDKNSKEYAQMFLGEDGYGADQGFWVEVDIPLTVAVIQGRLDDTKEG